MTEKYRLMIYFAVATLHIYSNGIDLSDCYNRNRFREKYSNIIKRVFDEALSIFNYELSSEQIDKAISVFILNTLNPQNVNSTEVYHV